MIAANAQEGTTSCAILDTTASFIEYLRLPLEQRFGLFYALWQIARRQSYSPLKYLYST